MVGWRHVRLTSHPTGDADGPVPGLSIRAAAGSPADLAHVGLLHAALRRRAVTVRAHLDRAPVTVVTIGLNPRAGAVLDVRDGHLEPTAYGPRFAPTGAPPNYALPRRPHGFLIAGHHALEVPRDPVLTALAPPLPLSADVLGQLPRVSAVANGSPAGELRATGLWQDERGRLNPGATWTFTAVSDCGHEVTGWLTAGAGPRHRRVEVSHLLEQGLGLLPDEAAHPVSDPLLPGEQSALPLDHPDPIKGPGTAR